MIINTDDEWNEHQFLNALRVAKEAYLNQWLQDDMSYSPTWISLIESIESYIEFKEWSSENNSNPISGSLIDKLEKQLRDSIIISASSNIEMNFIDSLLINISNCFNYGGDISLYHPHTFRDLPVSEKITLRAHCPRFMLNAIENTVPSKGANPSWMNIKKFMDTIHKNSSNDLTEYFNGKHLNTKALDHLASLRNEIAHGRSNSPAPIITLYFSCYYSFEVSRALIKLLQEGDLNQELIIPLSIINHNSFIDSISGI